MSTLVCVGLSHRSAPLALRERLAVPLQEMPALLRGLTAVPGVGEAVVVSTCNRVELYVAAAAGTVLPGADALRSLLQVRAAGVSLDAATYRHVEAEAARHLFRVAAGLDSLVVGETEILGQVREAYGAAAAAGATGPRLNPLFQQALASARRVHADTRIGAGRVSVAGVAVDLARRVFGSLAQVRALLLGTGETGRLTLRHLRDSGIGALSVWSRDAERGAALAREAGARAVAGALDAEASGAPLVAADLLITAVGDAPDLVPAAAVRSALRHRGQRPMVIIDLGVPRNVAGGVAALDNVFHYDVDALERVVQANLRERSAEVAAAEAVVAEAVGTFWKRHGEPDLPRTLADLHAALTALGEDEIAAMLDGLAGLPAPERERVAQAARRLVNRLVHRPLRAIAQAAENGGAGGLTEAARRLFDLDGPRRGEGSAGTGDPSSHS